MGRVVKKASILLAVVFFTGCNNNLENYVFDNLFGPPYRAKEANFSGSVSGVTGAVNFGFSVDIDGDYVITGMPAEYDNTEHEEGAFIYHRTGPGQWDNGFKLPLPSDWQKGDRFGFSTALYGDYAVVGAPYKAVKNSSAVDQAAAGAAYIYRRVPSSTEQNRWELLKIITQADAWGSGVSTGIDAVEYALFGYAVDIYANWIFISAKQDDLEEPVGSNYGAVYCFRLTGDSWDFKERLTAGINKLAGASFGGSLDAYGSYLAIGAFMEDIGGDNKVGAVYVFAFEVDGWASPQRIAASDGKAKDVFGNAVATDGNYLVISVVQKTVEGVDFAGSVYVYKRSKTGFNEWDSEPAAILTAADPGSMDFFGMSVAIATSEPVNDSINTTYKAILVGAVDKDNPATDSGAAYLYYLQPDGSWQLNTTLNPEVVEENTYFGRSVALSGRYAVIGAAHTYDYFDKGGVYIFR